MVEYSLYETEYFQFNEDEYFQSGLFCFVLFCIDPSAHI